MANDDEKTIRIVDRRMFTPEGDLRPEFLAEEPPEPAARPKPEQSAPSPPPEETVPRPGKTSETGEEPAEPRSDFASLVRSLATTAYSALGLLPDPSGGRRHDVGIARQMIDWLAMLEQKTRGNTSFEEADFLSRVLYELRLAYVEVTRPPTGSEAGRR